VKLDATLEIYGALADRPTITVKVRCGHCGREIATRRIPVEAWETWEQAGLPDLVHFARYARCCDAVQRQRP